MPKASVTRLIERDKAKLINFVLDIEKYPEFIPFCIDSKVYEKREDDEVVNIIADLTIGKKPFVDTTYAVKRDDYFLTDRVAVDEDNKSLALSYLGDIWETITGDLLPQFFTDRFGRDPKGIQLKINSGEIGIAIGQIPNETIKRRVIQNLYNAASSIGVFKGLNKEERDIIGAAGLNQTTNALRADFVGGIHVKIF